MPTQDDVSFPSVIMPTRYQMHCLLIWFSIFLWIVSSANGWWVSLASSHTFCHALVLQQLRGGGVDSEHTAGPFEASVDHAATSEVVGAFGRMGSFWLCHQEDQDSVSNVAAVPRGLAPGCLSEPGCPIFVATPSTAWPSIWEQTLEGRREDLIFVGNGIPPSDDFAVSTIMVPHFSILKTCTRNQTENPIGTSRLSPKTYLYGKHAKYTASILELYGVSTEVVDSFSTIRAKAAWKLVWASCMWLLCHQGSVPLTVEQVHQQDSYSAQLERLVADIHPALKTVAPQSSMTDILDYMKQYSLSIPNAIPSKELAIAELMDRNIVWLQKRTTENPQDFHQHLIEHVVSKNAVEQMLSNNEQQRLQENTPSTIADLEEIGLRVTGRASSGSSIGSSLPLQKVVIVGGGIVGSSVAYYLARRQPELQIQVLDLLSERDFGKTTPASWAWLNGNGKNPKSYQLLNQLGLHVWKKCKIVSHLPSWMGSLVRFVSPPKFVEEGGYPNMGPLSMSQIRELEPFANWQLEDTKNEGATYFFPNEGCVNPAHAVQAFRTAAEGLGVSFVSNQNVTRILRNETTGLVRGVECSDPSGGVIPADLVLVAAGIGSSAKSLGGLPLLHKPGQISYAQPMEQTSNRLSRILVDPIRSSHVLQRTDGSIVAGGGALETGGSSGTLVFSNTEGGATQSMLLLEKAGQLSPTILHQAKFTHSAEAIRPMPKDGLPAIGYLAQGHYIIVTHSGMTLGPLLSALAATEITEDMACDLLNPFRPSRFFEDL